MLVVTSKILFSGICLQRANLATIPFVLKPVMMEKARLDRESPIRHSSIISNQHTGHPRTCFGPETAPAAMPLRGVLPGFL
jgi:hypothetical protein